MARKRVNALKSVPRPATDDFTRIHGIGPVTEKNLHEAGIHTFRQLAALTPKTIAAIIPSLSAQKVVEQKWIDQARHLCPGKKKPGHSQKEAAPSASRQHYENFTLEFLLDGKNKIRRIQLIYVQSGDTDTWTKWDPERLIDFLARHTGMRLPYAKSSREVTFEPKPTPPPTEVIVKKTLTSPITISSENHDLAPINEAVEVQTEGPATIGPPVPEIAALKSTLPTSLTNTTNRVCLLEWKTVLANSDKPVRHLSPTQEFDVNLTIDLNSVYLPDIPRINIRAELYARKMGHGTRQMVAETETTKPNANIVCLAIRNAALPQGFYRLEALLAINPTGMTIPDGSGVTTVVQGELIQVY